MIKVLSENRIAGQTSIHHQQNDSLPLYGININTKRVEAFAKTGYILDDHGDKSLGTQFSGVYHQQKSTYGFKQFDTKQATFTGTVLYQTNIKDNDNHIIVGGANFVYDKIDEQLDSVQIQRNDIVPGFFAEYTFKWNSKITLVSGVRGDYHSRAGFQVSPEYTQNLI